MPCSHTMGSSLFTHCAHPSVGCVHNLPPVINCTVSAWQKVPAASSAWEGTWQRDDGHFANRKEHLQAEALQASHPRRSRQPAPASSAVCLHALWVISPWSWLGCHLQSLLLCSVATAEIRASPDGVRKWGIYQCGCCSGISALSPENLQISYDFLPFFLLLGAYPASETRRLCV